MYKGNGAESYSVGVPPSCRVQGLGLELHRELTVMRSVTAKHTLDFHVDARTNKIYTGATESKCSDPNALIVADMSWISWKMRDRLRFRVLQLPLKKLTFYDNGGMVTSRFANGSLF